ncbi:MAG: hypothetical protein EBS84_22780 [Proteobacteria bacterium]|nr:hypothetical protein [Pseudomonadota bacterium]
MHGQVEALVQKETKDGKPFWELTLADAEGKGNCRSTPERILSRRPVASLGEGGERSVKRDREEQIKLPPC